MDGKLAHVLAGVGFEHADGSMPLLEMPEGVNSQALLPLI